MVVALLVLGWFWPTLGNRWIRPVEQAAVNFSEKRRLSIVTIGLAAILTRLAILPVQPVPVPSIHDEFSNLLGADTYAHGRLANPPHPMWLFFDTFHVLQHPTYASKYPPAPGMVLAIGEVLGHPWIGTLLTLGIMCMAFTWMLQAWVPAPWALVGGAFVLLRLCLFNTWFNGYLGAGITAIGAALVLGSYRRLIQLDRWRDSLTLGVGAVLLLLSRPLEGFIFCLPIAVALVFQILSRQETRHQAVTLRSVIPAVAVIAIGVTFFGYYDWRVTGHVLLAPYAVYQRDYFAGFPIFVWQKIPPAIHYANAQFEDFFNSWLRSAFPLTLHDWATRAASSVGLWWSIYIGRPLSLTVLSFPYVLSDRRMRLPLIQFFLCAFGLLCVVWFQPNYAAALSATVFLLIVQGMRHLRRFTWSGKPSGIYLTRLVIVLMLGWNVVLGAREVLHPPALWTPDRVRIAEQLQTLPGKHLVLVDYAPTHNPHQEWVYNAADIDSSGIVWARVIPGRDLTPLLSYFKDRQVWILHPDSSPPRLERACPLESHNSRVFCGSPLTLY